MKRAPRKPGSLLRSPTLRDVANLSKVSQKTVSRVVNGESNVHVRTRAKVQQAIAELGYRPDLMARSLRSNGRFYGVGLVYDNPNEHYVIGMQEGVLSVCETHGYGLQIIPCRANAEDLTKRLLVAMERSRLGGLILTPPMSEQPSLIQSLKYHHVACVRIISASRAPRDGLPCVYVNDRSAAYAITAHLIQLGHARIAFLGGDRTHGSNLERYAGYAQALSDYGVPLDKERVIHSHFTFDDGFRGARKLLAGTAAPTAIFGCNDEIAAGVLAAARSMGLSVPRDLSIAGFEDSPFARQAWPPLTTAQQSPHAIAAAAALRLIHQLDGSPRDPNGLDESPCQEFIPELVIRASTAPPSGVA